MEDRKWLGKYGGDPYVTEVRSDIQYVKGSSYWTVNGFSLLESKPGAYLFSHPISMSGYR